MRGIVLMSVYRDSPATRKAKRSALTELDPLRKIT
jgi:hypothetical protein